MYTKIYQCITTNGTANSSITYFFFVLQTCDVDVDRVASEGHSSPSILVTGNAGEERAQYFICCEKRILLESRGMKEAVINLMSVFYVFDLAYPKELAAILIFIQNYILGFKDSRKLPLSVQKLICNLNRLNAESQD